MTLQSPSPVLARHDDGAVALLTLCRPDKRNPLSEALLSALTAELDAIAADRSIRAVILAAEGAGLLRGPRPQGAERAARRC